MSLILVTVKKLKSWLKDRQKVRLQKTRFSNLEELEQKILLSADVAPIFSDIPHNETDVNSSYVMQYDAELISKKLATENKDSYVAKAIKKELVIIDKNVDDYERLLNDYDNNPFRDIQVVLIEPDDNGLAQIDAIISQYDDLDALHIISHGSDGAIQLGDTHLSHENVSEYAQMLSNWGQYLSSDADLLLYGCNLAASDTGKGLIDSIALLTGADVAASEDLTGHIKYGGDWQLEYQHGLIQTSSALSIELQSISEMLLNSEQEGAIELPLQFEQNMGQMHEDVDFASRGDNFNLYLSDSDVIIDLHGESISNVVKMSLQGVNKGAAVEGLAQTGAKTNYITDSMQLADVENYAKVAYHDIYSGIDVIYYGNQRQLEYDFVVQPGANADLIRVTYEGVENVSINESGQLVLQLPENRDPIIFKAPISYQVINGEQVSVASEYLLHDDGSIGFVLGAYDANYELIIDPILDYGTYIGGFGYDRVLDSVVDAEGKVYATGQTYSLDFPTTFGAYDKLIGGLSDVFVTKFSSDGSTIEYSTFVGGLFDDIGFSIVINDAGEAFVSGTTYSLDFPVNGFDTNHGGFGDAFVFKLDATGSNLLHSTFFGGSANDEVYSMTMDTSGDIYVTGYTTSNNFFTTGGVVESNYSNHEDAFATKLDADTGNVIYSTYLGASNDDFGYDIEVDSAGNAFIVGYTKSNDFYTTADAYSSNKTGSDDMFIIKIDATAENYLYATYFGGDKSDEAYAIKVTEAGDYYVGGWTESGDFPTTAGAYREVDLGDDDGFILHFSSANTLLESTYWGGQGKDYIYDLDIDSNGQVHVVGQTRSSDMYTTIDAHQNTFDSGYDGFLTIFNSTLSDVLYSTYFGGADADNIYSINVADNNDIYLAGWTDSVDLHTTDGAYDENYNGFTDGFVAKFTALSPTDRPVVTLPGGDVNFMEGDPATLLDVTATVVDPDFEEFNGGDLTLKFTANSTANDQLVIQHQGMGVNQIGVAGSTISYEGNVIGTFAGGNNGSTPLAISFTTDHATAVAVEHLVRAISYANTAPNPSVLTRTVRVILRDSDLSTSTPVYKNINVSLLANNAPTAANTIVNTDEDSEYKFLLSDFNFSDIDGDSLTKIQITALETVGSLELRGVAVTLNQEVTLADITAGDLVFIPVADENGANYDNFEFRVHDGTEYSAAVYTISIDVNPQNDAPTASNSTIITDEDTEYTFSDSDFNFSDIDLDTLSKVQISSLEAVGSLELSGVAVSLNQEIDVADINAGHLRFVPLTNAFGVNYDSFQFRVHDGTTYSAGDYTMTIDVVSVNDAPTSANKNINVNEDGMHTFIIADFSFSDIDGDDFEKIQIASLNTSGLLELNGTAVTLNQEISVLDIVAGDFTFSPLPNEFGLGYADFSFHVHDGNEYSAQANRIIFDVTAVNDLPAAANAAVATLEDEVYTFNIDDFNLSDVDSDALFKVQITGLVSVGSLELNDVAVILNQEILAADISAGRLKFIPNSNESGINYDGFEFRVHDGTDYSSAAYNLSIDVKSQNDAPISQNRSVRMSEDGVYTVSAADFYFSDIDGNTLEQVKITSSVTNGLLALNGDSVRINQAISINDINAGRLKFIPDAHEFGMEYAKFSFKVNDGTSDSVQNYYFNINVDPVNDAPSSRNFTINLLENENYTLKLSDYLFVDHDPGDAISAIEITHVPANGRLTLNGIDVTENQVISKSDIISGLLQYTPGLDESGNNYALFKFKVLDQSGAASSEFQSTINVARPFIPVVESRTTVAAVAAETLVEAKETLVEVVEKVYEEQVVEETEAQQESTAQTNMHNTSKVSIAYNHSESFTLVSVGNFSVFTEKEMLAQNQMRELTRIQAYEKLESKFEQSLPMAFEMISLQEAQFGAMDEPLMVFNVQNATKGAGATFSTLIAGYTLRGTTLMASLMSSLPVWSHFDPVPIMGARTKDQLEEGDNVDDFFKKVDKEKVKNKDDDGCST